MKIAFIIINYNRREGTSRAIAEVAERLGGIHEVHVFSNTAESMDHHKVHWHRVRAFNYPHVAEFLSFVLSLKRILKMDEFDIIHCAGALKEESDIYTIQNIQPAKEKILQKLTENDHVSALRKFTRKLYLRQTARYEKLCYEGQVKKCAFLPVSSGVQRELEVYYPGCLRNLIRCIPNGTDTEVFQRMPDSKRTAWREEYGFEANDLVCIFSGGEWYRKGLDFAIKALSRIEDGRVKLFVAGDDPKRESFEDLVHEYKLQKRVIFGGYRKDIAGCLGACDLFLFPSHYEAFSLATLEAAACELPVLATRINGTEDFIRDGLNGFFLEHDPEQIAAVIRSAASSREVLREMGKTARKIVCDSYSWDSITNATEAAYAEILAIRKAKSDD